MTPFEIDILLHYYSRCEDHDVLTRNPPIWPKTRDAFISEGLMEEIPAEERSERHPMTYRLTARGKAYIEHLQAVPLPIIKWVLPDVRGDRNFPPRH